MVSWSKLVALSNAAIAIGVIEEEEVCTVVVKLHLLLKLFARIGSQI